MAAIEWGDIEKRLEWEATTEAYDRIRDVWRQHCETELRRDMEGLLATLTDDCVYTVQRASAGQNTRQQWHGKAGARQFYEELFLAFPDQNWHPEAVVIGPQGVFTAVVLHAPQATPWAGLPPSAAPVSIRFFVYFIWDPDQGKFAGETFYLAPIEA